MDSPGSLPTALRRDRRRAGRWIVVGAIVLGVIAAVIILFPRPSLSTNVTIALSYVADDGETYSCTYDYRTSDRLAMPAEIAARMNERDWSRTGQLIYERARAHPAESWTTQDELPADDPNSTRADASWSLAMEHYIQFPPWTIDAGNGPEYELWWEARPGSNCEDGLR